MYTGTYDEVQGNIRSYGALESCRLIPGYFADSLREYRTPCVLAFIDVDLRDSLEDCVRAIWSHMAPGSALFVHEAEHHETAAFFFDTEWWRRELDCEPPGGEARWDSPSRIPTGTITSTSSPRDERGWLARGLR
jgi:hypothetical protein